MRSKWGKLGNRDGGWLGRKSHLTADKATLVLSYGPHLADSVYADRKSSLLQVSDLRMIRPPRRDDRWVVQTEALVVPFRVLTAGMAAAVMQCILGKEAGEMGFRLGNMLLDRTTRFHRTGPNHLGWCAMVLMGGSLLLSGCGSETGGPAQATGPAASNLTAQPTPHVAAKPTTPAKKKPDTDQLHPVVVIKTSAGEVTVRLDAQSAPITVSNFLEYVERGFYEGTIFHQVVDGYIVLGGGFTEDLTPKDALPPIRNEAHNGLKNRRGTIAMARRPDAIDSSTSQFFFNLGDNTSLDHQSRESEAYGYCVFGEIVEGLSTLEEIARIPVRDTDQFELLPERTVKIESVKRLR